jgi:hypothetical protein
MRVCSIEGCGRRSHARSWCKAHYHRWQNYGDPLGGGIWHGSVPKFINDIVMPYDGDACLDWPFSQKKGRGYGHIRVNGRTLTASRYICMLAHGEPPSPHYGAAHSCGRPACVAPRHLSWKTQAENIADELIHGTRNHGMRHGLSRMTDDVVLAIRRECARGRKQTDIAKEFGVSKSSVWYANSRGWKHI